MVIGYIFSLFGMLYKEKSGNPGLADGHKCSCRWKSIMRGIDFKK
jgi:hypothetical protein